VVRVVWWSSALDLGVTPADRGATPMAHLDLFRTTAPGAGIAEPHQISPDRAIS
jgi:hypothetical protein